MTLSKRGSNFIPETNLNNSVSHHTEVTERASLRPQCYGEGQFRCLNSFWLEPFPYLLFISVFCSALDHGRGMSRQVDLFGVTSLNEAVLLIYYILRIVLGSRYDVEN